MSVPFNLRLNLIVVRTRIWGPSGDTILRLALDTGSTSTLINKSRLVAAGYDPQTSTDQVRLATGSSVELVPRVHVDRIDALEQTRTKLQVVCHTVPPSTGIDGLLGLDFFRDSQLVIDFRNGQITLS
jgi:predicted aspartyl protease